MRMKKKRRATRKVGGNGGKGLPELERREEDRKREAEREEDSMSDSEFGQSIRKEYGSGKWADRLTGDLERDRKNRAKKTGRTEG
jgi:hypothetical protein